MVTTNENLPKNKHGVLFKKNLLDHLTASHADKDVSSLATSSCRAAFQFRLLNWRSTAKSATLQSASTAIGSS
jgi:hypothetical protein